MMKEQKLNAYGMTPLTGKHYLYMDLVTLHLSCLGQW